MKENPKKQKIFDNLFNMTYEPVVVDKKPNQLSKKHYTTIFNALNNAQEHIMIKINPGIYNERLQITKKDLKIQATEITQNSILINQQHPNIIINLPSTTDKIFLQSLKLANACQNNSRHEIINGSYESLKKQDYMNFKINSAMNCCIYVKKGIVQLDECKVSLAAYHNEQTALPCIVVEREGCLIMNRSEVRGGAGTVGIFSLGGKVIIKQSIIRDHGVAGIIFSQKQPALNLTIKNTNFIKCNEGIILNGPFQAAIQNNSITDSSEAGIVIYNGNQSKITNNQIHRCKVGIQIKNSYPSVLKNTICNSEEWGFIIKSSRGLLCKPILKFNIINQNSAGGILIEGSLNNTNILNNELRFNNHYGIKVINRASPHIFTNKIINTIGNGVHISCHCSSFVEKNQIEGSLKCNLVLEGPNNVDNFIFRNIITKARGQGIFCIFGQKFTIKDNEIKENYNGILSLTGVQNIEQNSISQNQRNGILLIRDNNVNISGNQIENNKKAGIFIRDSSIGKVQQNSFSNNRTEIVIENDDAIFSNIEQNNQFQEGYDIRIPKNYRCQLI